MGGFAHLAATSNEHRKDQSQCEANPQTNPSFVLSDKLTHCRWQKYQVSIISNQLYNR